jgi:hypothetical protein
MVVGIAGLSSLEGEIQPGLDPMLGWSIDESTGAQWRPLTSSEATVLVFPGQRAWATQQPTPLSAALEANLNTTILVAFQDALFVGAVQFRGEQSITAVVAGIANQPQDGAPAGRDGLYDNQVHFYHVHGPGIALDLASAALHPTASSTAVSPDARITGEGRINGTSAYLTGPHPALIMPVTEYVVAVEIPCGTGDGVSCIASGPSPRH